MYITFYVYEMYISIVIDKTDLWTYEIDISYAFQKLHSTITYRRPNT